MEKANLKICSFYVSDWHLTAMLLPYIEDAIERSERLNTIFEKNISYNMKEILTRIKISDRKKDEIMKVGWENKEIVKYNDIKKYMEKITKVANKITIIVEGHKDRIECISKNIDRWIKKSEKKLDVIVTITLSMVLLLCYNTFLCYVFTMCHIPIHLGSLTITNILVVLGLTRKNTL